MKKTTICVSKRVAELLRKAKQQLENELGVSRLTWDDFFKKILSTKEKE